MCQSGPENAQASAALSVYKGPRTDARHPAPERDVAGRNVERGVLAPSFWFGFQGDGTCAVTFAEGLLSTPFEVTADT